MDSYQIIERRPCDAGLTVSFVGDKGHAALAQAELSESKMAVLTNLCARYDAEAMAPVVIGANGVEAGERPRIVDFLVDRDALGLACGLSQTAVSSALKTLRDGGILELGAVFRGKTTKVKPEHFAGAITDLIPVEDVEARRRREKMRLQVMCGYIGAIDKRGYIRRYFES
jgi:DNA-binding transcriptional ArsR family regulator